MVLRASAEVVLVAVLLALFVRTFLLQAFVVPTASMEKTIQAGDHLVVNKFIYAPRAHRFWTRLLPYREIRRGDVFVFKFPGDPRRDFIKRAIGLPGDTIAIRDKVVFVNGLPLEETRAFHSDPRIWPDDPRLPEATRVRDQLSPLRVPEDFIFAMGDNRDGSNDSRFWGPVAVGKVKGRALFVYWSLRPGDKPGRGPVTWMTDLFSRLRWSRSFRPVR
ncbi:MAG TPA: signal peptidase I [Thermoanaerobaculia bacterium]|nr:signal peptidase I [Thermoanaerobaculia bacterium]